MTVFDLYDMHCHLAFSPDTRASAIALRQEGIGGMCATVTPDEYHLASLALADELSRNSNFKLGVGLHPWWLSDGSCGADAVDKLVAYAAETRFIGEIGLDFAPRRAESAQLQRTVSRASPAAARGKVLSVHAVKSAGVTLDLMESVGLVVPGAPQAPQNPQGTAVIFHWFSGSGVELARAIECGCYFPSTLACFPPSAAARMCSKSLKKNCCLKATCRPPRARNSTLEKCARCWKRPSSIWQSCAGAASIH